MINLESDKLLYTKSRRPLWNTLTTTGTRSMAKATCVSETHERQYKLLNGTSLTHNNYEVAWNRTNFFGARFFCSNNNDDNASNQDFDPPWLPGWFIRLGSNLLADQHDAQRHCCASEELNYPTSAAGQTGSVWLFLTCLWLLACALSPAILGLNPSIFFHDWNVLQKNNALRCISTNGNKKPTFEFP